MAQQDPEVADVRITHPDRVLYPDIGLTKLDLARYYQAVADRMLPHLIGRPLTLKQCAPDVGRCQFLRHTGRYSPKHVRSVSIREQKKVGRYMVVETVTALVSLAQYRVVEEGEDVRLAPGTVLRVRIDQPLTLR